MPICLVMYFAKGTRKSMVSFADGKCICSKRWETSVFGGGKEGDRKRASRKRERRGEIRAVSKAGTERGCRMQNGHGRNSSFFSACPSPKPEGRTSEDRGGGHTPALPPSPHLTRSPWLSLQLPPPFCHPFLFSTSPCFTFFSSAHFLNL